MLNQQWILIQDSTKVQSTSIFSCLPLRLIPWMMPRHKLLAPVMHTLGVWPIHIMPPSLHYMPEVCIIRHKKMCPGSHSTKMSPIITRHVLVEHLGSHGKEEADGTLRTHCCFTVLYFRVPKSLSKRTESATDVAFLRTYLCHFSTKSPFTLWWETVIM
jgi:hypothetical protein